MSGVHVCDICKCAYDETGRKPLVLLCGHTYCVLEVKNRINVNLQQVKASIQTIQQLESMTDITDELKESIPIMKRSLLKQESTLINLLEVLEESSSEPSLEQKNLVLKMLKNQNQMQLEGDSVNKALKPFQDQVVQCQIYNLPNGKKIKLTYEESYMPDGHPWVIISNELAEKALCTMKEPGHQTPKATVISTDESPILCLPELLQYLAASSATMELQLMDRAVKNPYVKDWLPLKAGGEKSTDFNHCYRLTTLAKTLKSFQTMAADPNTVGEVVNDAAENKVVILVYPETFTYDVYVLAFGKIVKGNTGSWPLPLEVHVIGMTQKGHFEWVKSILSSLYYIAQPNMGECRVSLPKYSYRDKVYTNTLFPVFVKLGEKFFTKHRLYLPRNNDNPYNLKEAKGHNIALEFKDF